MSLIDTITDVFQRAEGIKQLQEVRQEQSTQNLYKTVWGNAVPTTSSEAKAKNSGTKPTTSPSIDWGASGSYGQDDSREKTSGDLMWERGSQSNEPKSYQAKLKAESAKKKLEDYRASEEYKQAAEERYKQAEQKQKEQAVVNLFMGKDPSFSAVQPEADPVETRLKAEYDQAQAEADALANEEVMVSDLEAITGLSNEDRQLLEQYAVNQIRDQNLPVEMVGRMPSAQQEASALIEKYGKQRVDELAESYMRQKNAELAKTVEEQSREFANDHGVIGSALTVPVAAVSGAVGTVGQLQGAARNTGRYSTLDPNATGTIGDVFTGAVRGQVAQNIEQDNGIMGKVGSVVYQGAMSAADSIARAYLGGGAFGGAALAATGSFSQTMADASRQGATPAQAALLATVNSGIEALSEKIPLDDLIKTANGTNGGAVLKNAFRQMGIEATTEEISLLGTLLSEAAILQEKSGYNQTVTTQLLMGKSLEEAKSIAAKEILDEAVNTALVSAVSGIGGGFTASGVNAANMGTLKPDIQGTVADLKDSAATIRDMASGLKPKLNTGSPNKSADQMAQEAIANNRARHEAMAAEEAARPVQKPETASQPQQPTVETQPAQPVQQAPTQPKTAQEVVDEILTGNQNNATQNAPQTAQDKQKEIVDLFVNPNKGNAAATEAATEVNGNPETDSDYQDEFENWGADPNREGVEDPLAGRNHSEVGKRNVKAYMYENPAVKPFYQEQAAWLLSELNDTTKGERTYNEQLHYESGGEQGWTGTKRQTSDSIAQLLDESGMTYDQIEKGLTAIINDNGQENNAVSKRIEFIINDRLMNGYTDFYTGKRVSGNAEYLNLLRNQQSTPTTDMQMDASNQSAEGGQQTETEPEQPQMQRDRVNAVREQAIPVTDPQGGKVSDFVGNAYQSALTPDSFTDSIQRLVNEGQVSHDVQTNEESLRKGAEMIAKLETERAAVDAIRDYANEGSTSPEYIAMGTLLYQDLTTQIDQQTKAGKVDPNLKSDAESVFLSLQQMATNSGRALQLYNLFRKMTPESQVNVLKNEVMWELSKLQKRGTVKKDYTPQFNQELLDEYRNAAEDFQKAKDPKTKKEAEQSMEELQKAVYAWEAAQMPTTFKAKWDAWRYMAMLGNAKTQLRNVAGNTAMLPYTDAKRVIGTAMEKAFIRDKSKRTKAVINIASKEDMALLNWAKSDRGGAAVKTALENSSKLGDDIKNSDFADHIKTFGNGKVAEQFNRLQKIVGDVTSAGDIVFKNREYATSLAGFLKARGYTAADIEAGLVNDDVMNEARNYAIDEALKATFNDANWLSDTLSSMRFKNPDNPVKSLVNSLGDGLMPFRKTPANVLMRGIEYSPAGFLKTMVTTGNDLRNGEYSAATLIDRLAANLTGTAAFVLGQALARGIGNVKLVGGGVDEDEERQGHQEYAIEVTINGETYSYTIDWAAPANLPLFLGANLQAAMDAQSTESKLTAWLDVGMGVLEPMLELSCMSSLKDFAEDLRYAKEGEAAYVILSNLMTSYFTQGIPSLARQATQALTENKQTTLTTSDDPVVQKMQEFFAGLGVGNPYKTDKINEWGETESNGNLGERIVNAFLNPGKLKKIDDSGLEKEIERLNKSQETDVTPPSAAKTITYTDKDGNLHKDQRLTEEQYQTLATTQGQTAKKIIFDLINSKDYKALSDEQKAEAIKLAYSYARETGEQAAFEDSLGYSESWMMDMSGKSDKAGYILNKVGTAMLSGAMGKLDVAWDNKYNAANQSALSDQLAKEFESYTKMTETAKKEVYGSLTGTAKKYVEARENGVSHDDFLKAAKGINDVKGTGKYDPDTGKNAVREIDKRTVIADMPGLSDSARDTLMRAYMTDYDPTDESPTKTEPKYDFIRQEMGLTASQYADSYRVYLDVSGKYNEIHGIMAAIGCDYGTASKLRNLYGGWYKGADWNKFLDMYVSK